MPTAVLFSALFHVVLFLLLPGLETLLGTPPDVPTPPAMVEVVAADELVDETEPAEAPADEAMEASETAEVATEPEPEDEPPATEELDEEPGEAEDGEGGETAAVEEPTGDAEEGVAEAPEAMGNSDQPVPATSDEPPAPPMGGNAEEGETEVQGTESELPDVPAPLGGTEDEPPAELGGELPDGGEEPGSEMAAYGAEMGEEVTLPEDWREARLLPGVEEGLPSTAELLAYDWGPYLRKVRAHLDQVVTPTLPPSIEDHVKDPVVRVVVARDGKVLSRKLRQTSFDTNVDEAVLDGLEKFGLPPLPEDWEKDLAVVALKFKLRR